jgi:hypothetical protein
MPAARLTLRFDGLLGISAMFILAACASDDGGPRCVDQLCDPATTAATCHFNSVQKCAADGLSYSFTPCYAQERCDASVSPARCAIRACANPGVSTCLNAAERETCLADGSARVSENCGAGSSCRDGECVPVDCTTAEDMCTTNGFLRCVQGQWQSTTCPTGQVCQMNGEVPSCGPRRCTPNTARCEDRKVYACDALGATETEIPCAEGEICTQGQCQPLVCGVTPTEDTTGGDTAEQPTEIRFSINGVVQTLTLNAQATYTEVGRVFTISASRNSRRLEIRFAPIARLTTGAWDSEIFNPTLVTVCYTDGLSGEGVGDCPAPFTHASSAYKVAISRNGGIGERVDGTFDVTLTDVNRDTLELTDGSFSVVHR